MVDTSLGRERSTAMRIVTYLGFQFIGSPIDPSNKIIQKMPLKVRISWEISRLFFFSTQTQWNIFIFFFLTFMIFFKHNETPCTKASAWTFDWILILSLFVLIDFSYYFHCLTSLLTFTREKDRTIFTSRQSLREWENVENQKRTLHNVRNISNALSETFPLSFLSFSFSFIFMLDAGKWTKSSAKTNVHDLLDVPNIMRMLNWYLLIAVAWLVRIFKQGTHIWFVVLHCYSSRTLSTRNFSI